MASRYLAKLLSAVMSLISLPTQLSLLSQNKFLEAEHLFKELLIYEEIQPDAIIFTTIIDGLCKTGHTSVAFMLFRYMEKKGWMPDTVSYSTIIDSLSKDRFVNDALGLLAEMSDGGIQPDVITYSSLIQGLSNLGRWKDIMQFLKDMDSRKISPDVHTYSILVDAHGRDGKIKDAEALIELMIQRGQYPNVVTYNSLMDGYCFCFENKKYDEGCVLIDEMVAQGFSVDASTTSMLFDLLTSKGQDSALLALQKKFLP
ncbi:hypothetical protein AgCh_001294 [Apium graveolens]